MTYNKKNAAIFETSIGIFSPEKKYYQEPKNQTFREKFPGNCFSDEVFQSSFLFCLVFLYFRS